MTYAGPVTAETLLAAQNPDGGWSFARGTSATEPTACAVLALAAAGASGEPVQRGRGWLLRIQRPDGGWPPRPSIAQSNYVTSLALLALQGNAASDVLRRGAEWLLNQSNRDASTIYRIRMMLLGTRRDLPSEEAWSWFPSTAAWVTPTALAMLALRPWRDSPLREPVRKRLASGEAYLWSRLCRDGGWNHGSSKALGYEADSYPETTGQALLALSGTRDERLPRALAAAERHLRACRSAEAASWLQLGLLAHRQPLPSVPVHLSRPRTVLDQALSLIAARAAAGQNPLLEAAHAA